MKYILTLGAAALAATTIFAGTVQAAGVKEYLRKGDQVIQVIEQDGKLYCRRVSDKFEMCHGMTKQDDGSWTGKHMKHPDMPGFMTFNGTVTFGSNGLKIRGCAVGVCQSEIWTNK
jgi:uncharacterized protein (DUF2147 family)